MSGEVGMNTTGETHSTEPQVDQPHFEVAVDVKAAARFLGVSPSLVYAYVERKQIPHFRMMGRSIRFSLSELEKWRQQFFVDGGINE
jgi:excisionase family DNA binding protein